MLNQRNQTQNPPPKIDPKPPNHRFERPNPNPKFKTRQQPPSQLLRSLPSLTTSTTWQVETSHIEDGAVERIVGNGVKGERCGFTVDLNPSLFKPKSKSSSTSTPLSLPKSKPPHLSLSFSKPISTPYPKNYNLKLKRKRNERKQRGREQSLSV